MERADDVRVAAPALAQVVALGVVKRGVGYVLRDAGARGVRRYCGELRKAPAPREGDERVGLHPHLANMHSRGGGLSTAGSHARAGHSHAAVDVEDHESRGLEEFGVREDDDEEFC